MSDMQLELRIQTLEQQMREVLQRMQSISSSDSVRKDWRKSLGMFDDHPLMKHIDEAGRHIRQQDREQDSV